MKRILLLLLLSLFLTNCQEKNINNKKTNVKEYVIDFIKTFEGNIGNYPILFKIKSDNGKITGKYVYKNKTNELKLIGTINKVGEIDLKEYDFQGNQTGIFKGKLISENKITGKWKKPNGTKELNFTLFSSNENYENFVNNKKEKIEKEKKSQNKVYTVDDIIGNWEIKMNTKNSDCEGVNTTTKYVENWIINSSNNILDVKVINSSTGVKNYTGYLKGNVIMLNTSQKGYKCSVKLYLNDENNCSGERKVIKSVPCSIEYYITAKKK